MGDELHVKMLDSADAPDSHEVIARNVADLMKTGMPLDNALKVNGLSKKAFNMAPKLREMINALVAGYWTPPEIMREAVRAGRAKVMLDNLGPAGDQKLALDAMKQIASDPEVGLNAAPAPLVEIRVENLGNALDTVVLPSFVQEASDEEA